ncbi:hypothetical protein BDQ94DRAFT_90595 [Aspergillus welwitschiae]|uniref:Uncharacterized protein n=1 Tax=Aspergillus welwitschiae TaxID=1341132 RepID=A0A3F3QE37_9EURO|nr:hypothetical protein BDQ94DRAFT_90595 [Aspergillus welwitschiae]RDH37511.1 hypothetical protein BDQ94DRAFT_90595 [Aspergillus welwitschiae]
MRMFFFPFWLGKADTFTIDTTFMTLRMARTLLFIVRISEESEIWVVVLLCMLYDTTRTHRPYTVDRQSCHV